MRNQQENISIFKFRFFFRSALNIWCGAVWSVQCAAHNNSNFNSDVHVPLKNFALLFVCNQAMRRYSHSCLQTANSSGSTCSAHKYTHTNLKTKKHQTKGIQITLATFDKNLMVSFLHSLWAAIAIAMDYLESQRFYAAWNASQFFTNTILFFAKVCVFFSLNLHP